ncbi:methyltransferase domain-containing protein [Georgenia sp. AZ-5]|uniref:methyltransferase domain-containing protein n=1 Tax=Georgenia sp. AZ-5 TaxID=3367526 RepID=UPI003754CB69
MSTTSAGPAHGTVDTGLLETMVKDLYRSVARDPQGPFHFPTGRAPAELLGYAADELAEMPAGAVASFAGVGYFFDLAALAPGEVVVDLGCGSGMDAFCAARRVGPDGKVLGIDMTPEQLDNARRLAAAAGIGNVAFREGRIEDLPLENETVDCLISNGVINLCPDKSRVFQEAARVLRPGGRLALADIVSERPLKQAIVCDVTLWAACIGGAEQWDDYREAIERAGLVVTATRTNPYEFLSDRARSASARYGVRSISLLAIKFR